jgi:hypothetical protein
MEPTACLNILEKGNSLAHTGIRTLKCPARSLVNICINFFVSCEGPRSRRYGRTAALRLIVQPYDEDEDDYYFYPFPSNGALVE